MLELRRSPLAIALDADLRFDPLFFGMRRQVMERLREFKPDVIHLTSSGDFGIVGALESRRLNVPLALAWHTNVHEFAGRRVESMLRLLPRAVRESAGQAVEKVVWRASVWFYGLGNLVLAPNRELIDAIHARTRKPVFLMERGIDTRLFDPSRRTRADAAFIMGFVGRLQPEKNLRLLARVEAALLQAGVSDFRFLIAGQGDERPWLEENLKHAHCTGVLTGIPLAEAYANMDVFVFPSHTDTYGNVIQEAAASGVPSVVTSSGGPKFLVRDGVDGLVARTDEEFCAHVVRLAAERDLLRRMGQEARRKSEDKSWDRVFERVYDAYRQVLADSSSAS